MDADDNFLAALPKSELHVHLDGSIRATTMFELAVERGISLPAPDPDALKSHMLVRDGATLEEYLERFELTLAVMQDPHALERISHELILDHAAEGVRWAEVRFCPQLNRRQGLTIDEVLEAALHGMRRAEREVADAGGRIDSAIIVCGLRSHAAHITAETAEAAVAYAGRGVCGFDLAGAEAGHPVSDHREAVDRAYAAGLPITLHAGEGFGPESIRQALDVGHARRIGHGTRLREDPALLRRVRDEGIPLEVCLTSNVQTGVVPTLAAHPARLYQQAGVSVSLGTDNRLMSGVTLRDEYRHARDQLSMSRDELTTLARAGFEHAFVSDVMRRQLLDDFDTVVAELGSHPEIRH